VDSAHLDRDRLHLVRRLKADPGASPAEGLIRDSLPFLPMDFFIPVLALWEIAIGLGFIVGRYMRVIILVMMMQMVGTISPIFLNPQAVFVQFPFRLTLEGQYIFKNAVLIAGAFVIGATVRGGKLAEEKNEKSFPISNQIVTE
jgi:uncharacterized membrane protein YphA (DoxX/SURF4 family)